MEHLRANGVGVPPIFAADSGDTAIEIGEWTYEVHGIAAGLDLYEDAISWTPFQSVEHASSAGEMLARLHLAAESYGAPARKPRPLVASFTIFASQDAREALEQYLAARPELDQDAQTRSDCEEALTLLAPFHDELKPILPSLHPLWTHNDLHASNLFWSDTTPHARATAIIDFGLADRTNAVYDIAQAIERNIVEWLVLMRDPKCGEEVPVHLDHLWAMLDGYEQVRPLSEAEAAALAPMLALSHAEFALTEADYFLGVLHSARKGSRRHQRLSRRTCAMVSRPGRAKAARSLTPLGRGARRPGGARMILIYDCPLSRRKLGRTRRLRHHRRRHLAHYQTTAHLLARRSRRRHSLSRRLLSCPAAFRRAAPDILHRLHPLRLVALVARRARRR